MIFVTVGTQLPFERLVRGVDEWARNNDEEIRAQIGKSEYIPKQLKWEAFIEPKKYEKEFFKASLVIAHAGTGVIMKALQQEKPIIVMPRKEKFQEHRNDHQVATAMRFQDTQGVYVAWDVEKLNYLLEKKHELKGGYKIEPYASGLLVETLREFINT